MSAKPVNTAESAPTGPKHSATPASLVVSSAVRESNAIAEIRSKAEKKNWNVVHLSLTEGQLPEGLVPNSAIIADATVKDPLYIRLKRMGSCIVNLDYSPHRADSVHPAVLDDFETEGKLAAEHFTERGFRNVAFPVWSPHEPSLRFKRFRAQASELGCNYYPLIFKQCRMNRVESREHYHSRRFASHFDDFRKWIQRVPKPIALACPTDYLAARYTYMAVQLDFEVPNDIAILGRGNILDVCECAPVHISSINSNVQERIGAAFKLLDDMQAGRPIPTEPILIPPEGITVRASTDVRVTADALVSKALQFIWSHYSDLNLSVDLVADAVGCSRRKIEYLFRSEMNKTINSFILERRMERCRDMLIKSNITVTDLCHYIGLRSKKHLHRVFKQTHGITPLQYRIAKRDTLE